MKTKLTFTLLAVLGAVALAASAQENNPPGDGPPTGDTQRPQHRDGAGGRGGFHLLPPRAAETLKLTDDQKAQLAALEAETKAKLEKILTADQMTQLKNMRPPMRQGGLGGQMGGGRGQGKGSGGDENGMPPGPPPGEDGGNTPPSGPPQGGN